MNWYRTVCPTTIGCGFAGALAAAPAGRVVAGSGLVAGPGFVVAAAPVPVPAPGVARYSPAPNHASTPGATLARTRWPSTSVTVASTQPVARFTCTRSPILGASAAAA